MRVTNDETQIASFFAKYEPAIAKLGKALRAKLRDRLPGLLELVYVYENQSSLVISYSPTQDGDDGVCAIALYPDGVNLFFAAGRSVVEVGSGQAAAGQRQVGASRRDELGCGLRSRGDRSVDRGRIEAREGASRSEREGLGDHQGSGTEAARAPRCESSATGLQTSQGEDSALTKFLRVARDHYRIHGSTASLARVFDETAPALFHGLLAHATERGSVLHGFDLSRPIGRAPGPSRSSNAALLGAASVAPSPRRRCSMPRSSLLLFSALGVALALAPQGAPTAADLKAQEALVGTWLYAGEVTPDRPVAERGTDYGSLFTIRLEKEEIFIERPRSTSASMRLPRNGSERTESEGDTKRTNPAAGATGRSTLSCAPTRRARGSAWSRRRTTSSSPARTGCA